MFSSFSTPTAVPLRSTWCINSHSGMNQNQTVGMNCVKLRCKCYKLLAHILRMKGLWEISTALPIVVSVFTVSCPDCVLTSLLPHMLNEPTTHASQPNSSISPFRITFTNTQTKGSTFPHGSLCTLFMPLSSQLHRPHRQVGIKSVPTS